MLIRKGQRAGYAKCATAREKVESEGRVLPIEFFPRTFPPSFSNDLFWLQSAYSVSDVASVLKMDSGKFFFVVQNAQNGSYYRTFEIPKRKGGVRTISVPQKGLGIAQTRLAKILLDNYRPKSCVRGYVKGESFITNASYHERRKWILNVDIEDFFPSITFPRVFGLFKSSLFGFNHQVSTILARITTTPNGLPQGARTSPIIANIIANNLDKKMLEIASRFQLRYTRYADDITISSSQRNIPSAIIQSWEPKFGNREVHLGNEVIEAFRSSGFSINRKKTRILFPYERQEVTGLIVNKKANVWRKDISRLRMILHSAHKHGGDAAAKLWISPNASEGDFWEYVTGWLSYIRQVRGKDDAVLAKLCRAAVIAGIKQVDWIERSADMVREFDVFLSHASEDKDKVRRLKDQLIEANLTVFFDEDSIRWGDSITEKINHGLLKSIFFVPFLSDNFQIKGWTNRELNSAISANIGRKGRILPIKDENFSIDENYPLLNETLYKVWPSSNDSDFIQETTDALVKIVEEQRAKDI